MFAQHRIPNDDDGDDDDDDDDDDDVLTIKHVQPQRLINVLTALSVIKSHARSVFFKLRINKN